MDNDNSIMLITYLPVILWWFFWNKQKLIKFHWISSEPHFFDAFDELFVKIQKNKEQRPQDDINCHMDHWKLGITTIFDKYLMK